MIFKCEKTLLSLLLSFTFSVFFIFKVKLIIFSVLLSWCWMEDGRWTAWPTEKFFRKTRMSADQIAGEVSLRQNRPLSAFVQRIGVRLGLIDCKGTQNKDKFIHIVFMCQVVCMCVYTQLLSAWWPSSWSNEWHQHIILYAFVLHILQL